MRLLSASTAFLATVVLCAPAENSPAPIHGSLDHSKVRRDGRFYERDVVPYNCAATKKYPMLKTFHMSKYSSSASDFCSSYLMKTIVKTEGATQTIDDTTTTTPDAMIITDVNSVTVTAPDAVTLTSTTTITSVAGIPPPPPCFDFSCGDSSSSFKMHKRDGSLPTYPDFIPAAKPAALVKAACKCIIGQAPRTTVVSTVTTASVTDFTATITADTPTVTQSTDTTTTTTQTSTVAGPSIYCNVPGCDSGSVDLHSYWQDASVPINNLQDCVNACNSYPGCNNVLFGPQFGDPQGRAGYFCIILSGTVPDAVGETSSDCQIYRFYDKNCAI